MKTEWKPISEMKENGVMYWLLDENNIIGNGYQEHDRFIIYNKKATPEEFSKLVMSAEIKPPEKPCL